MSALPEDVARTVAKGVAAYLRAAATPELPPALATLKKTVQAPKALARQRDRLLAVLEDEAQRALILEWLEDGKPALSQGEVEALKLATERPEGWADRLAERTKAARGPAPSSSSNVVELERKLEREKEAHRKAKEEAKRAKGAELAAIKVERARSLRLDEELSDLRALMREREADVRDARAVAERATKELERTKRKARSDVDDLRERLQQSRDEARELKKKLTALERETAAASRSSKRAAAAKSPATEERPRGPRVVLPVPKGRLADAPETLAEWLRRDDVTLLVDGYNVTRSATGYGHLALEQQRERLRDSLKNLANRLKVETVLVWDGGEVEPGTRRPGAGYLTEEYSEADRSGTGADRDRADRHIVGRLKTMPPRPVVLVTNDRGLQDEARRERATIATSAQLLAQLR
ncbi:MAG: NYN domain-containing protein [Actinomycetota bacterium]|nr:NYN domain-containing protein [Actinomycetota bacterium]